MNDFTSVREKFLSQLTNGSEEELIETLNIEITDDCGDKSTLLHHDLHYDVFDGDAWESVIKLLNKGYVKALEVISENFAKHDPRISVLGTIYGANDGLDFNENSYTSFHVADTHEATCDVTKVSFPNVAIRTRDGEVIVEIDRKALNFNFGMSEHPEITESEFGDFTKDATKVTVVTTLGV